VFTAVSAQVAGILAGATSSSSNRDQQSFFILSSLQKLENYNLLDMIIHNF
jgi:hypothetical protein